MQNAGTSNNQKTSVAIITKRTCLDFFSTNVHKLPTYFNKTKRKSAPVWRFCQCHLHNLLIFSSKKLNYIRIPHIQKYNHDGWSLSLHNCLQVWMFLNKCQALWILAAVVACYFGLNCNKATTNTWVSHRL